MTVYATDDRGNVSNKVTFNVTLIGELKFGTVNQTSSFKDTTLTGKNQQILRNDNWEIEVDNTLGIGSTWQLQVAATPFTNDVDGTALAGGAVYVKDGTTTAIGTTPIQINEQTATQNSETTDVTKQWNTSTGIFMNVEGSALGGSYSGDLKWTLINAVTP